ncbi:MAG TPA: hypothetical protein VHV80_05610, partial [Steroidobacteraceae bacterium]|nr:hypothetical protein [Steroidobacteraceae bacterium]
MTAAAVPKSQRKGVSVRGSPYDEMLEASGAPRSHCRDYWRWLEAQSQEHLAQKRSEADALFHRVGITFAVYGEGSG